VKNIIKITTLFLTLFVFSCSSKNITELEITSSSKEAIKYYKKAMEYYQIGENFEKRTYLDSALSIDPNLVLGLEFYQDTDFFKRKEQQKKAQSLLNTVTKEEQQILLIRDSYRKENMEKALSHAKELVVLKPNSYEAYNWLGIVQSDRFEIEDAIKSLERSIDLNKNNYTAYNYLAGFHIPLGDRKMLPAEKRDIQKGLKYSEELIRIRPDAGLSYQFKANCYRALGEFEKAKPLYEKGVDVSKGQSREGSLLLVSGHNYMFSGDFDKARERYKQAIEKGSKSPNGFWLNDYLVWSYLFEGNFTGAINSISKINAKIESSSFGEQDKLQMKAGTSFKEFIVFGHNQMEKETKDALIKNTQERNSLAKMRGDSLSLVEARETDVWIESWFHVLFGRYKEAKETLSLLRSLKEKKKDPSALFGYNGLMGMVKLGEGEASSALSFFNKSNPNDIYITFQKALAHRANGEKEEAKKILENISGLNFSSWEVAILKNQAKTVLSRL
tara:strand:+ start:2497 stop:4002 length:1506 start_codon:yes stop_codon:yes gene_type:complete